MNCIMSRNSLLIPAFPWVVKNKDYCYCDQSQHEVEGGRDGFFFRFLRVAILL